MTNSEQSTKTASKTTSSANDHILGTTNDKTNSDVENIYIDLETLLDVRIGVLAQMDQKRVVELLNSGKYHKRHTDLFAGVNRQEYLAAYAKRDIDTLKHSVLTNMVFFLKRLIKDSLMSAIVQQKVEKMCFTVNVYPFEFEDPDLIEMLIGCVRFHTYSAATIQVVSIPNELLTPKYCHDNFQIMIRYHWHDWVELHKEYFQTKGVPELVLVLPELFIENEPTKEDILQFGMKHHNPFDETVKGFAGLFRIKFMPASLYSIHENITKKTASSVIARVAVTEQEILDYLDKSHPKATLVRDNPLPNVDLSESFELL